ncbi:MAG TPA: alanyl-tRNA editing protein [Candidatus Dormibacteraeota bacterium]|nr:alanyl-tRNA editing protein [Candidatus Dormibacteraeota bacterium]
MATKRIYYDDAFVREFEAEVLTCEQHAGNSAKRWRVLLDRTALYPASGGQPYDRGKVGEAEVLEVVDEGEEIAHFVDRPMALGKVKAVVDWKRRFDHMQQHTGQHLLSAVLQSRFGLETVSFHLGEEICTIDLRGTEPSAEALVRAEQAANEIIFEDRPVNVKYGTIEELRSLGVRKEVDREGILRAIEIEGVELQPCGGTHVARTGQIGMIQLRRCTKIRQDWRLEFLCGGRVAKVARDDYETRQRIAEKLQCAVEEVDGALEKALAERDASYKSARARGERLAKLEAETIVRDTPDVVGRIKIIARVIEGLEASFVLMLAPAIAGHEKTVALLARKECGQLFFGQHASVGKDMNALLRKVVGEVGGKGGGTKDFARGGLKDPATAQTAIDLAVKELGL